MINREVVISIEKALGALLFAVQHLRLSQEQLELARKITDSGHRYFIDTSDNVRRITSKAEQDTLDWA